MLGRIAIHLSDDKACARRIDAGVLLAKEHGAEVVGVYPTEDFIDRYGNVLPQDIRSNLRKQRVEHRESIRNQFEQKTSAAGVSADWREPHGSAEESLALHARYCDLLIMSKALHDDQVTNLMPNLPEAVIMAAGRPVLMIPNAGTFETIGQRVLYCWDQRREAARAFADAAPFLERCKELVVLEVDRDQDMLQERDIQDGDFSNYCVRRGYPKPRHQVTESGDIGVGHVILNAASDAASDLIVMGAYGHSRMRQWVMGGASRTLLSSMTVPVLLTQ